MLGQDFGGARRRRLSTTSAIRPLSLCSRAVLACAGFYFDVFAIALPDADLDRSADALVGAGFRSAGERCMAISVLVAVGDIADELDAEIAERTRNSAVGTEDATAIWAHWSSRKYSKISASRTAFPGEVAVPPPVASVDGHRNSVVCHVNGTRRLSVAAVSCRW
ncbi:aldehyde dehydrogenase family protein [Nocardia testacea]|uniref:aldehyde dehydrogenase family protein n=1 Tax=Nocardia testacea TaxID=248551 RepID=UPI003C2B7C1A